MTAEYAKDNPATTTSLPKVDKAKLTSLLSTHGSSIDGIAQYGTKYDYWKGRHPRSIARLLSMPKDHPDGAGFLAATAVEINSVRDMGTSKVGMSKYVFTKKFTPDGAFNKYECRE